MSGWLDNIPNLNGSEESVQGIYDFRFMIWDLPPPVSPPGRNDNYR